MQTNQINIRAAQTGLEQAQEGLRVNRLRCQAGVGEQRDVIDAERDLNQAELNLATAILDFNRAVIRLEKATNRGQLSP
jgi:outer membrane protein TolC